MYMSSFSASTATYTALFTKNDQKKRKTFTDGVCKMEKVVSATREEYAVTLLDTAGAKITKGILNSTLDIGGEIILNGFLVQIESLLTESAASTIKQTSLQPSKFENKKFKGSSSSSSVKSEGNPGDSESSSATSSTSSSLISSKFKPVIGVGGFPLLKSNSSSSSSGGGGSVLSGHTSLMHSSLSKSAIPQQQQKPDLDQLLKNKMNPHQIEAANWIISKFEDDEIIEVFPSSCDVKSGGGSAMSEDDDDDDDDDFISDSIAFGSSSSKNVVKKPETKNKCRGVILADEMGLGKSLTAISVIWAYVKMGRSKAVIVCPSTLINNWEREVNKWMGLKLKAIVLRPGATAAQSLQTFNVGHQSMSRLLIISYEMYRNLGKEINSMNNVDLIILDEGHRMKNMKGTQTSSFISQSPASKRLLLTGTPIQNDLQELFSLLSFVQPSILGEMSEIQSKIIKPIQRGVDITATSREKGAAEIASNALNSYLSKVLMRRTQADVLKKLLPPRYDYIIHCAMSCSQLSEYCSVSNSILRSLNMSTMSINSDTLPVLSAASSSSSTSGSSTSHLIPAIQINKKDDEFSDDEDENTSEMGMVLNQLQKLRLICSTVEAKSAPNTEKIKSSSNSSGSSSLTNHQTSTSLLSKWAIVEEILKSISSSKEKIVIVSNFTLALDVLQSLCVKGNFQFCRLDGSVPSSKRFDIVEDFNRAGSPKTVFLLSSKAGGMGINLVGASRLIMLDCDWNPATDLQAMSRIWRQGQTKECFIYRLITKFSIEDAILMRQRSKHVLQGVFTTKINQDEDEDEDEIIKSEDNTNKKAKKSNKSDSSSSAKSNIIDVYDNRGSADSKTGSSSITNDNNDNDDDDDVDDVDVNADGNDDDDVAVTDQAISRAFNQRLSLTKKEIIDLICPRSNDKPPTSRKKSSSSSSSSGGGGGDGSGSGDSVFVTKDRLLQSCFLDLHRKGLVIDVVEVDASGEKK